MKNFINWFLNNIILYVIALVGLSCKFGFMGFVAACVYYMIDYEMSKDNINENETYKFVH